MFSKKVLLPLANLVALLLLLKAVFIIVIFVWGYFGPTPVTIFDPRASQIINVLLFIQELGTAAFLYLITAAAAGIVMHKGHEVAKPAAMKPARRTSRKK